MPPQHVEIADTIVALKRALRREKEAPSSQPISSATNRGNKLKRGATYVHSGSLPYRYSSHGYRERIEHAGYQRYILERNPKRYNEYGDELDESESDDEADPDADDENPYGAIRIEELLRPLTHPAELATHPTLSLPYLDTALPDMAKSTEAQLRQERANLWRAKNLHRQFIGDESWMPCERVEVSDDWDLFEPHQTVSSSTSSKKRKRGEGHIVENGVQGQDHAKTNTTTINRLSGTTLTNGSTKSHEVDAASGNTNDQKPSTEDNDVIEDKEMKDQPTSQTDDVDMANSDAPKTNGIHKSSEPETTLHRGKSPDATQHSGDHEEHNTADGNDKDNTNETGNDNQGTPPPPTRRITRALAAADTSSAPTPPLSPTTSTISSLSSSLLQPAPLFLLPPFLALAHTRHPASHLPLHVAHSGLPMDEIIETRRLLGMYIQKQEETIRGLEGVLGKLIKAKRMKDKLWEWCKAEGHVGEWSDGEDWVDAEAWGLRPDELRKGRDEEEQEVQEESRKGKRRRGREQ